MSQPPEPPQYGQQPPPYGQQPPPYGASSSPAWQPGPPQPQKESHVLRNVLLVLGGLLVLGCGGCLAVVAVGINAADEAIKEVQRDDAVPGGPRNPIDVEVGRPFTLDGMEFQRGWRLEGRRGPSARVERLRVLHDREGDRTVTEVITLTFYADGQVLGDSTCVSEPVSLGDTVPLICSPTTASVRGFDRITANDTL